MNDDQLLSELNALLRDAPTQDQVYDGNADGLEWVGRLTAALQKWDSTRYAEYLSIRGHLTSNHYFNTGTGLRGAIALLQEARHGIRLRSIAPTSLAIPAQAPFDYFDELRKIVELAQTDLFFVDPYLDPEFVARYLPQVRSGTIVRLLSQRNVAALVPAAQAFTQQHGLQISVRTATARIHDRFVFLDGVSCYQSGASFKDGAKVAPTTVTQIVDAFDAMKATYEAMWQAASVNL